MNYHLALQQYVSGVQALVDAHGRHAGHGFAASNGPLNGGRASIFRQQGSVHIDITNGWKLEHPGWNDAPISDHDDGIRRDRPKLLLEFIVLLDLIRLD